jgi:GAF domain-containing protein
MVAEFIWDQFKLYHVQVFLVDDINQNLILRTGIGQAGQELLVNNFSLPIKVDTVLGRSVLEGRSIVVDDTTVGNIDTSRNMPAAWYSVLMKEEQEKRPASLLPETLSELAIPLIVEDHVLGVLDLQDDKIRSFTEKDLSVYEAIAVQLSISIDSARQWELAQSAQQRAEQAVQHLTREAWTEQLRSSQMKPGFAYNLSQVTPLTSISSTRPSDENLAVPLVIQDQNIGQISVNKPSDRGWTDDEQALLRSIAQQLAQKAENLRLFEATQQRASREQIARRIIDKVRASRTIETALETAAEELNKVLGTVKASIDLQVTPTSRQAVGDSIEEQNSGVLPNTDLPAPANGKQSGETPVDLDGDLE